eukprot:4708181-Alexandrium_andersonii.AAC.1
MEAVGFVQQGNLGVSPMRCSSGLVAYCRLGILGVSMALWIAQQFSAVPLFCMLLSCDSAWP